MVSGLRLSRASCTAGTGTTALLSRRIGVGDRDLRRRRRQARRRKAQQQPQQRDAGLAGPELELVVHDDPRQDGQCPAPPGRWACIWFERVLSDGNCATKWAYHATKADAVAVGKHHSDRGQPVTIIDLATEPKRRRWERFELTDQQILAARGRAERGSEAWLLEQRRAAMSQAAQEQARSPKTAPRPAEGHERLRESNDD
jgi:hypothetical protein